MALETLLVGLREDWKGEGDYGCQNGCSKEGLVDETEIERSRLTLRKRDTIRQKETD